MKRRTLYIIFVLIFSLANCGLSLAAEEAAKYTRQACIQKVVFDWGGYGPQEIELTIRLIGDALNDNGGNVAPSFAFPYRARDQLYLQYRARCEHKLKKTQELMDSVLETVGQAMPNYDIVNETVIPSPKTISLKGSFWKKDQFD